MSTTLQLDEDLVLQKPEAGWEEGHIRLMVAGQQTLRQLVEDYFKRRLKADPKWDGQEWNYRPDIDRIEFEGDTVEVECSAPACGRGCCGSDCHTYKFPLSDLWSDIDTILAGIQAKREAEAAAKAEAERLAEEKRKADQEERERRLFEKLQAKFGGQTP